MDRDNGDDSDDYGDGYNNRQIFGASFCSFFFFSLFCKRR